LGNDAGLQGRRPAVFDENPHRGDILRRQFRQKTPARVVAAYNAYPVNPASHGVDIVHDVGRAAPEQVIGADIHNRHRGLGGNPRHLTADEVVHHDVPDDQYLRLGKLIHDFQCSFLSKQSAHKKGAP